MRPCDLNIPRRVSVPPCETHAYLITTPPTEVQPLAASTYGEFDRPHFTLNSIPANSKNQSCTLAKKSGSRESQSPRNSRENIACPWKNPARFTAQCGLFAVHHRTSTFPTTSKPDSATFPKTPSAPTPKPKQATQNSISPLRMARLPLSLIRNTTAAWAQPFTAYSASASASASRSISASSSMSPSSSPDSYAVINARR